jgi:hypothetical protein
MASAAIVAAVVLAGVTVTGSATHHPIRVAAGSFDWDGTASSSAVTQAG